MKCLKTRLVAVLFVAIGCSAAVAQKKLAQPLIFVPADSVVLWGETYSDLRGMALGVDATLTEQPVVCSPATFRADLKTWQREVTGGFSPTGVDADGGRTSVAMNGSRVMGLAAALFLQTGESVFMEAVERLLFNDLLHEVLQPGEVTFDKHMAARALVNGTGMIYAVQGSDIWVNLYTNNTTHIRTPELDVVVDQLTAMPLDGRVKVRLSGFPRNGYRVRLHLRLPRWAEGRGFPEERYTLTTPKPLAQPTFYVNGREVLAPQMEHGYYVIDRQWNRGDEVYFDLPMQPQYVARRSAQQDAGEARVALQSGPLVYVVPDSCATGALDMAQLPVRRVDDSGSVVLDGRYAASGSGAASPAAGFTALPYLQAAGRLWLPVAGHK